MILRNRSFAAMFLLWGVAIGVAAAAAPTLEIELYDASPVPGRSLTWGVDLHRLPDDQGNLPRPAKVCAKLSEQSTGELTRDYTLTPDRPGRYLLMPVIRDSWKMVDRRAFWVDYPKGQKLTPMDFRVVVRPGQRGPYSSGGTTVFCRDTGVLIVCIETGKPGNVFPAGEPMNYGISLQGPAGTVRINPVLIDWKGNRTPQAAWEAKLAEDTPAKHTLSIQPSDVGFYRLLLEIPGWGEAWLDGGTVPPKDVSNDRIGINVSWSDRYTHSSDFVEGDAELLELQNVRWLRTEYEWRQVEGVRGQYDWSWMDFYQDVGKKHGMQMLPAIFRIPPWASPAPDAPDHFHYCMKPEYFEDYGRYVQALATRYKDWIRYYSIWNEVDSCWFQGGGPEQYLAILKDCYRRIQAVDKSLKVTSSGFAASGAGTSGNFHREVFRLGGARFFDVLDIHYADRSDMQHFAGDLRKLAHVERPIWITEEAGHQTADRTLSAAATQASERIHSLLAAYAGNPEKLFLWGDIDQHPDLLLWGNVKAEDRTPRPAYFAFANFIRLLAERRCVEVYGETPDLYAYRFAAAGQPDVLAMWSQSGTAVALDGIDGNASRIDLMGVSTELTPMEGKLVMPVDSEPVYLRCRSRRLSLRPMATLGNRQIAVVPGQEGLLRLRLYNPWKQERTARITASLPNGWALIPVESQRRLAPGERATVELRVRLADDAPVGQLVPFELRVTGLADYVIQAGGAVRVSPSEGVLLIEAESAVRSQGRCPGSPMHLGDDGSASGGAVVCMFWGGGWMEYEVPFSRSGRYRLDVRAWGRFEGHPDETKGPLLLEVSLDGKPIGKLVFPLGWTTRSMEFVVSQPGVHTLKLCFPVDAGDLFVDFFTIRKR